MRSHVVVVMSFLICFFCFVSGASNGGQWAKLLVILLENRKLTNAFFVRILLRDAHSHGCVVREFRIDYRTGDDRNILGPR
jgi:hypothetical protein